MAEVQAYRLFNVQLARKTAVSPSLLRLVFSGAEVAQMKRDAPDQRIKMLFPSEDGTPPSLPAQGQWYQMALSLPKGKRPVIRTYTLRHVDRERQEATVEFVSHGTEGPASAWAINAVPGDAIQIVAPNAAHKEDSGGYEWTPPAGLRNALIIADETALPAARGILELIAGQENPPTVQAFFEVPEAEDCVDLSEFSFAEIIWLARKPTGATHGECLIQAIKERVKVPESRQHAAVREEAEGELLWDKATTGNSEFYGWVAAESTAVKLLRRYLIGERGVPREAINFMAYWAKS
ncbi:NADPH-dependent ferric siderophore reductase [Brenneria goodwinii]|uniref:Iron-chelator utilization protein n=1 Tax=Brenneria goodwinii TaxID=1109412 RepID=A0A0G4K2I5_9GAMM|nr:siderophore-interacting protein [Brenneria goodwinii]ATA24575.1 iron utilization protein [Brenneria goodwinii]MCG8157720.1 siderophore-interacting protein [Brenneria goodwinii]MCG8163798.1 siderophore-interacting protein [Brenneria goodwinii]MCG8168417.1 siderophore-interacting protein [Brenneria goodwinii]MCG8170026.1 siderophore-interacting protein [Brenneria goodwinii]